jgi:uncharacterized membrane protein YkvA (DUF1232 family)
MPNQTESEFIQNLRSKIENWSKTEIGQANQWLKYIRLTPDFLQLLTKLSADENLSIADKAKIAVAISYFMSPMDFIPETYWGAVGFIDDLVLSAYVLAQIIAANDAELLQKHWQAGGHIGTIIDEILSSAEQMVGRNYWDKLKNLVK